MTQERDGRDQDVARGARALFERAAKVVPATTDAQLRRRRMTALHDAGPARPRTMAWGLPAGAVAALLVGLAWWRGVPAPPASPPGAPTVAQSPDVVALPAAAPDEAELYAWLAEAPVASDAGTDGAL